LLAARLRCRHRVRGRGSTSCASACGRGSRTAMNDPDLFIELSDIDAHDLAVHTG
jgi:hypothetical protein